MLLLARMYERSYGCDNQPAAEREREAAQWMQRYRDAAAACEGVF